MPRPGKITGKSEGQSNSSGGFLSMLNGEIDAEELSRQFADQLAQISAVANDPLGILGHPLPTPAERKAVEVLAKELNRPAKLCRRALLKTGHDLAGARKLLHDPDFCRRHMEIDPAKMGKFRNPYEGRQYYLRQEAIYLGRTEQEIAPELAKLQKQAEQYDKQRQEAKQKGEPPRVLKDPVLGNLKWREFTWDGQVVVPGFGRMSLTVETSDDLNLRKLPDDKHREVFKKFVACAVQLRKAVEQANFKHLHRVRKSYEESSMPVPKVSSADKLWRYLSTPVVTIPMQRGKLWKVALTWNCTWDEEHGHLVGVRDGKVAYVGLQGDGW